MFAIGGEQRNEYTGDFDYKDQVYNNLDKIKCAKKTNRRLYGILE